MLKKFLAASFGWKGMAAAVAITMAVSATLSFTAGWQVSSWKHSASELGKLEAAITDATNKVTEIGKIADANAEKEAQLHQQYLDDSRRLADYVEASGARRITDDDIRVWYSSAPPGED